MSKNNKMSLLAISCILVFSKAAFAFAAEPVSSVLSNSSKPTPPAFAANASAPQSYLQQEGSGVTKYPTWHVSLESTQATTLPTPTVAARTTGKIYVAAGNQVFVIDPSSADHKPTLLCTLPKVGQVAIQTPPALSLNEDTLYVSYSDKVYAINLNPNDDPRQKVGGIVWIFNGKDLYSSIIGFSSPQVDPGTGMIFVTAFNIFNQSSVYCIDSSGHTSLLFRSYGPVKGYEPDFFKWELAPDGKGGVISVAYDKDRNPYINAYVKDNYNWWSDAERYVKFTSPALDKERSKVYVGGSDGYLYVYNNEANRGNVGGPLKISLTRPSTGFPNEGFQSAPSVATDGTVYIDDVNGYLYAVNANGQKKWAIKPSLIPDADVPFQFKTRPIVYRNANNKNIIYLVDASGALFAVQDNGASGAVVWKNYSIQAASAPALLSNGDDVTVIVSTLLGEVAAFEG